MFDLSPITGFFGAEVGGIDLADPLPDDVAEKLRAALYEHKVLVFRDQFRVGPAEQLAAVGYFGQYTDVHPFHDHLDEHPDVTVLEFAGTTPYPADRWHTDGATRHSPAWVSLLRAVDIPPYGRDTCFADLETAYDHLSAPIRELIDGLSAEHAWGDYLPEAPPVVHPLVLENPYTGRRAIYANRTYTTGIVGLRRDESDAILDLLVQQSMTPAFQLRVRWEPGTMVVWFNQSTTHHLIGDLDYARVMHRVMVCETPPPAVG